MKMIAPCGVKKTSPLHNCLVASNRATKWAKILEILKNEKKAREYKDLYTNKCWYWSHCKTIFHEFDHPEKQQLSDATVY